MPLALQRVVADRGGGAEGLVEAASFAAGFGPEGSKMRAYQTTRNA